MRLDQSYDWTRYYNNKPIIPFLSSFRIYVNQNMNETSEWLTSHPVKFLSVKSLNLFQLLLLKLLRVRLI